MKRIKMLLTVIAVIMLLSGCSERRDKRSRKKGNVDQLCRYRKGRKISVCSEGIRDAADDRLQY